MANSLLFSNIILESFHETELGQFKAHSGGIEWKDYGGVKSIEVCMGEIAGITWIKGLWHQFHCRHVNGLYKFIGFQEQDVDGLNNFFQNSAQTTPEELEEKQLSTNGRNYVKVDLNDNVLTFLVGSEQAFEVSLPNLSINFETESRAVLNILGETEASLNILGNERHLDFSAYSGMSMTFHMPDCGTRFGRHRLRYEFPVEKYLPKMDEDISVKELVTTFNWVDTYLGRRLCNFELGRFSMKLHSYAKHLEIEYTRIGRLYVLPRVMIKPRDATTTFVVLMQPRDATTTFVLATLDPPIHFDACWYSYLLMEFITEKVVQVDIQMSEELLNANYRGRLEASYKGPTYEVFSSILAGLADKQVIGAGSFPNCQDRFAVPAMGNYKFRPHPGVLYPLSGGFIFLPSPITLIAHDEIEYVEFKRHVAEGSSMYSSCCFDLVIKERDGKEHIFRKIQMTDYWNLFQFISERELEIKNGVTQWRTTGVCTSAFERDDDNSDASLSVRELEIKNGATHTSDLEIDDDKSVEIDLFAAKESYEKEPSPKKPRKEIKVGFTKKKRSFVVGRRLESSQGPSTCS